MNTARLRYLGLVVISLVLVGSMLACEIGGGPSKPTITITAPSSDAQFEEGDEVNVLSSADDAKGVVRVELYVDGDLYRTDSSPSADGETSLAMVQTWQAAGVGMHTLSVVAYNVDGVESDPWAVTIEVVESGAGPPPAATNTPAPPPAATDTPEPPPEATATTEPPPEETEAPPTDTPEPTNTPEEEPELPDLVLDQLSIVPTDPDWGGSIEVAVDVGNYGNAPAGPHTIIFRYGSGALDVCEWDRPALNPGSGGTNHCTVDHVYASYTTEATVDSREEVDESNEDNNSMQLAMEVGPSPPDLHITEIRFVPDPPVQGSSTHVGVKVHNQGGTAAGSFKVTWRSGEPGSVLEWTITSLAPGASAWAQWPYTYIGHGHFITYAEVDADGDVDEIDEDNNESSRAIDVTPS
jgi:subtilase family serine protease